jgi:outer membrane receptor for ferrienterochelin and colicins
MPRAPVAPGSASGTRRQTHARRWPFAGLWLLLGSVGAAALADDCRISGHVRDTSGRTIAGAVVLLEQLATTTTTDADGRYCLAGMPDGSYRIVVTADGFYSSHPVTIALGGGSATADVVMQPAFAAEIVVTGTRSERRLDDVPVRTEVVQRDEIEHIEARTLADAVEFSPGVRVESNCQNCNFQQIRLLGLEGAYTQLLVDSQPIISSLAQVYGIEHIPAHMIERIEVVKGGGSAIYGAGSVGGVVNVIPRVPTQSGGDIGVRTESYDGATGSTSLSGSLDWVAPDGELFLSAFGQFDSVDPFDVDGDGFTEVSRRDLEAAGVRGAWFTLDGKARLGLDYAHLTEKRRGGDSLDKPEYMAQVAESVNTARDTWALSWHHAPSLRFDYRLGLAMAHTERDSYYGSGMDPSAYGSSDNPLLVADSQFNHRLGSHFFSWGLQYSRDELTDSQPAYERFIADTYSSLGLFFQDDWIMGGGWELLYGARVDDYSKLSDLIVSPRLALKYAPLPNLTWRLSVASGFRGPQVFDEDLHITQVGGEGQVIRNDPGLEEERSLSASLGLEWTPLIWGGVGLVEANLFSTDLEDLFLVIDDDQPLTPEVEFTRTNFGSAVIRGAEMNLGWARGDDLQLQLGVVVQEAERAQPDPDFGSTEFFRTPEVYGVASLAWKIASVCDLWLGARYTGSMKVSHYAGYVPDDRLETSDSFLTLDLRLSREFAFASAPGTRLRLSLGGRNITDAYQGDLDQGANRDAGYVYGPRFPRSFYLSLALSFSPRQAWTS